MPVKYSLPSWSKHPKDGYLGRRNYILNVTRLFNIRTPYCTSIMPQLGRYHHTTVPEKVIMVLIPSSQERKERNGGILKRRKAEEIRGNRPLPSSKNPRLQNECKTFLAIMSFTCMRIKKIIFILMASRLACLGATRKWPITRHWLIKG